jgi:hypothetical protein
MNNKRVEINHAGLSFSLKTTILVAILYQGKVVKMSSGKCGWSSVGAAKNALRHEFYGARHIINDWEDFYKLFEFKEM